MQSARGSLVARLALTALGAAALAGMTPGCSALLDWKGYAGGDAGDAEAATPIVDSSDAGKMDQDGGGASSGSMPKCSSGNCSGCCNASGECVGGQSTATCGAGGASCIDCSPTGLVCSGGACSAPAPEAGPPSTCDPGACAQTLCIPVWQAGCCKSDNTCGCYALAPKTPCM